MSPPRMVVILLGMVSLGLCINMPQSILLRGGAQMAEKAADDLGTAIHATPPAKLKRSRTRLQRKPLRTQNVASNILRDSATTAICLALIRTALTTNFDMHMAVVPRNMRGLAWMLVGGAFSLMLYTAVLLLNVQRAMALCRALFGDAKGFAGMAPAFLFALGSVASTQSLPMGGG